MTGFLKTIVVQSHAPVVSDVVGLATQSVQAWADANGFDYALRHDDIFDLIPFACVRAAGKRIQMATDIARLAWLQKQLDDGWARVVWLDADVFVYRPDMLSVDVTDGYAFGREHWIQPDAAGKLKVVNNVHNALLVFTPKGRATLDFYYQQAERLLLAAGPNVPAQLVGPKLLTALHNVVRFPLIDSVGMASPRVLADLAKGGGHGDGQAWDMLNNAHTGKLAALNLSTSLLGTTTDGVHVDNDLLQAAVANLPS